MKICLIVVCAIVLCTVIAIQPLAYRNCLRLNPFEIDSVELYFTVRQQDGCVVLERKHHIELTDEEIWKLLMLYNLSSPIGTVTEETPSVHDRLEICFKSGTAMILYMCPDGHFQLLPGDHTISAERLDDYIQELIAQHS